jgi:hypothetical protein
MHIKCDRNRTRYKASATKRTDIMAMFRRTVIAAGLIWIVPALGQPAPEHGRAVQPAAPPAEMMNPGMMGGGPMNRGPGGSGMIERGQVGPGAMGTGMMPMMDMMTGARSGAEHIEGRLAFIKAELKITDAQSAQWDAFAEATRSNARSMSEIRNAMMSRSNSPGTLPDRLALEEKAMTAHLTALKKTEEAVAKLYGVLTDQQKKIADGIVLGPMGMPMGMMGG